MKFKQVDKYYLASDKHTICKIIIDDLVLYELWQGNQFIYRDKDLAKVKAYATTPPL